jgi:hypothetical protein
LKQPALVVDEQHHRIVRVDHPLVDFGHDFFLKRRALGSAPRHRDVCMKE